MNLFDKDYTNLSTEEKSIFQEYIELEPDLLQMMKNPSYKVDSQSNYIKQLDILEKNPFILNIDSLFPNNYLNEIDLKINRNSYIHKLQLFTNLIDDKTITERDILNFIRNEKAFFLIGSILKNYTIYGHHDRYFFQEIMLPPNHQADFLLIGKNSHGYHFLFFELENPYGGITIKDGNFGNTIRKGLIQVDDWKVWLEQNFSSLRNVLDKHKKPNSTLPKEFYEFDSTRIEYVVIGGRRTDFNEKTNRLRRNYIKQGITILHYDNVVDESLKLIKSGNY